MKKATTLGDEPVDELFLRIWLGDGQLMRNEIEAIVAT